MKNEIVKLSDLQPDNHNANRGTERGRALLEKSLQQYGAGRSILLDKNGRIIAGNKTAQTAGEIGIEDVILVRTKGNQLVAVLREDLDLDEEAARMLAYADNRVGQLSLEFAPDILLQDKNDGLPLGEFWFDWELQSLSSDSDVNHYAGLPEFDQKSISDNKISVYFEDDVGRKTLAELLGQSITPDTKFIWFPKNAKPKRQDVHTMKVINES